MHVVGPVFGLFALMWLALPVLIALLIVWLVRSSRPRYVPPPPGPSGAPLSETPLEILARRFAAGEITADEYQKARDLLQGGNPPATTS